MRELKFRVWDEKYKRFVKGDLFFEQEAQGTFEPDCYHDEEGEIHCMKFSQRKLDRYHGYVIQQYTGLQDKNGIDIYEGDLLKWHEGDHELSEVVFQNGSFFVKGVNWGALWYVGDYNDSYEIVGNVFDTPELLK